LVLSSIDLFPVNWLHTLNKIYASHFQGGASAAPPCPCLRAPVHTVQTILCILMILMTDDDTFCYAMQQVERTYDGQDTNWLKLEKCVSRSSIIEVRGNVCSFSRKSQYYLRPKLQQLSLSSLLPNTSLSGPEFPKSN